MRRFSRRTPFVRRQRSLTLEFSPLEPRTLLSAGTPPRLPSVLSSASQHAVELAGSLSRELTTLASSHTTRAESRLLTQLDHAALRAGNAAGRHPRWAEHVINRVERVVAKLDPGWSPASSSSGNTQSLGSKDTSSNAGSAALGSTASESSPIVTDPITDYSAAAQAWQDLISTPGQPFLILQTDQSPNQAPFTMIPGVPDYAYHLLEGTNLKVLYDAGYVPRGGTQPGSFGSGSQSTTSLPTVVNYTWDFSQAPDAEVQSGPSGDSVSITWYVPAAAGVAYAPDANPPMHLDTITVTANLSNGTHISQTYTFYIVVGGADWYSELGRDRSGSPPVHPYPAFPTNVPDNNA